METHGYLKEGYLPGWPDKIKIVKTSAGIQIFEFFLGEDEEVRGEDGKILFTDKAVERKNPVTGTTEKGFDRGNLDKYYSAHLYTVLLNARDRTIICLRGENRESKT